MGLPAGSSVLIDGEPIQSAVTRLSAGRHVVAISAPLHTFYEEQVEIVAHDHYELAPVLVKQGVGAPPATCAEPGATYNTGHACYDVRPRPVEAARVPLTPSIRGTPSPSRVLVKVSAEGHPLVVQGFRPSSDPAFEQMARDYVARVPWRPATLDGVPVEAWTTWTVVGVRSHVAPPPVPAAGPAPDVAP